MSAPQDNKWKYRDYVITVDSKGVFEAESLDGKSNLSAFNLKSVKAKIDKQLGRGVGVRVAMVEDDPPGLTFGLLGQIHETRKSYRFVLDKPDRGENKCLWVGGYWGGVKVIHGDHPQLKEVAAWIEELRKLKAHYDAMEHAIEKIVSRIGVPLKTPRHKREILEFEETTAEELSESLTRKVSVAERKALDKARKMKG